MVNFLEQYLLYCVRNTSVVSSYCSNWVSCGSSVSAPQHWGNIFWFGTIKRTQHSQRNPRRMQKLHHMLQTQGTRIRISPALLALNVNLLFVVFFYFLCHLVAAWVVRVLQKRWMGHASKPTTEAIWKVLGGTESNSLRPQQDCLHWFIRGGVINARLNSPARQQTPQSLRLKHDTWLKVTRLILG